MLQETVDDFGFLPKQERQLVRLLFGTHIQLRKNSLPLALYRELPIMACSAYPLTPKGVRLAAENAFVKE